MKKIIFDTETTGLLAPKLAPLYKQPYMTELYAIKVDENFKHIETIDILINVPVKLSPLIVKITGITDKLLSDKMNFTHHAEDIKKFFEDADEMIAHNLPFDKSILKYQFDRAEMEIKFPKKQTCTIQHSMALKGYRLSLQKLHTILTGKGFAKAHRAKNDVMALGRCYSIMLERGLCD